MAQPTALLHGERWPVQGFESIQPGTFDAATVVFPNMAAYRARDWTRKDGFIYGSHGTPTTFELEARIARLEGGLHCLLSPSGLSAIALVYMTFLKPGDELLVPLNVYAANRVFITHELAAWGIHVRLYDPTDLETLEFSDTTKLVWIEAPCSTTFEFPDIVEIAASAQARGVLTALDSTWGAGIAYRPFELGVDIAVQSLSKYANGSGDTVMGAITCNDKGLYEALKLCAMRMGLGVSARDAASILRGLDTLCVRYRAQDAAARFLVSELSRYGDVLRVLHPSLTACPGHTFWQRDCVAAAGIFSLVFQERFSSTDVDRFVDGLKLFKIGFGWGGPVSLALSYGRSVVSAEPLEGELVRISVGLEDPEDLLADLAQGLRLLPSID
ncbi:PLP-dependent transferase [Variovorax sp. CYS-02]|uniref:PLP-dependent transferase n=1 Tax=Variovorax terrae TaxID=2923278 RepID=A0A9X1VW60_9BURK|nr:PLP-dependent transferase [Variovorax terrae]MCJ0764502.1 PLP-dependent transferase [Variovorax terrae]